jgi:O-antigen ligase
VLRPAGATERFGLIHAAVRLMAAHPLGGVGARNFSAATRAVTPDQAMLDSVHNVPLLIGAELGLAGLIPAAVVVAVLLAVGWRHWSARSAHLWHGPVAGALAALALASLLDHYPWTVPQGGLLGAWLAGWWLTEDPRSLEDRPQRPAEPGPPERAASRSA